MAVVVLTRTILPVAALIAEALLLGWLSKVEKHTVAGMLRVYHSCLDVTCALLC